MILIGLKLGFKSSSPNYWIFKKLIIMHDFLKIGHYFMFRYMNKNLSLSKSQDKKRELNPLRSKYTRQKSGIKEKTLNNIISHKISLSVKNKSLLSFKYNFFDPKWIGKHELRSGWITFRTWLSQIKNFRSNLAALLISIIL